MGELNATIVRKISMATVVGKPSTIRNYPDGELCRIIGIVRGVQHGEGDNGPWTKFKGDFQGVNLMTGEVFVAPAAFFPGAISEVIETALETAQNGDAPVTEMQLAFDIVKTNDDSSTVGYVYSGRPLIAPQRNDPLAALAAEIGPPKLIATLDEIAPPEETGKKKK